MATVTFRLGFVLIVILSVVFLDGAVVSRNKNLSKSNFNVKKSLKRTEFLNSPPPHPGFRVTDTLKFVTIVSRHGNRPLKDYPKDLYPVNDTFFWPYGTDQLTTEGRVQMYKLGRKIRSLYDGFLSYTFNPQELRASSLSLDKTFMSGETFLAGLYPPRDFQVWDSHVLWQPVTMTSDSPDKSAVISDCPKYVEELKGVIVKFMKEYYEDISTMISYFNYVTGLNATGLDAVKYLYHMGDKLVTEALEGYFTPRWTDKLFPNPLLDFVGRIYVNLYSGTFETTRLVIGTLYTEVLGFMQAKVNGTLHEERRVQYYSGHDSTLVALQTALGIPSSDVVGLVKPGSALVLELHQNSTSSQYYVEAIIVDGYTKDWEVTYTLNIPNCGSPCDFNKFVNNTQNYTNVNFDQECQVSSDFKTEETSSLIGFSTKYLKEMLI